ncbi:unnamed protein product, partial [Durusdinium trenchii]
MTSSKRLLCSCCILLSSNRQLASRVKVMVVQPPTAAKTRSTPYARSSSSVDSFQVEDELKKLEHRLGEKLRVGPTSKPIATPARTAAAPKVLTTVQPVPPGLPPPKVSALVPSGTPPPNQPVMAPPPKVSAMVPSRTPPPTQVNARVPSGAPPPQVNARAQVPSGAPPKVSVPVPVPKSCGSSAKSTPIKSPELKKSKMEVVNLAHDFDSVATTVSADSQPVEGDLAGTPAHDSVIGSECGGIGRDIATISTLPMGDSMEDLGRLDLDVLAVDQPLIMCMNKWHSDMSLNDMRVDVNTWVKRRTDLGDISKMDPHLTLSVKEIATINKQIADRTKTAASMKVEHHLLEQNLDLAGRDLLAKQYARTKEMFPDLDPKDTDIYMAHVDAVARWKHDKLKPTLDAQQVFDRCTADIEEQLGRMLDFMVDHARIRDGNAVVEKGLIEDLDAFVQKHHDTKVPQVGSSRSEADHHDLLKDHLEVATFPGVQEIAQDASEPPTPHLRAQMDLMRRLDTTQLEA